MKNARTLETPHREIFPRGKIFSIKERGQSRVEKPLPGVPREPGAKLPRAQKNLGKPKGDS